MNIQALRCLSTVVLTSSLLGLTQSNASARPQQDATGAASARNVSIESVADLFDKTAVSGGLVVYVGNGSSGIVDELCNDQNHVVQVLCTDLEHVATLRQRLLKQHRYGRISVRQWQGSHLPFADNLVNLLIIEDARAIESREAFRALAPKGVVGIGQHGVWNLQRKPRPATIDQWTHYLHGPDNNAVADDTIVGPPRHVQWIGAPKFARAHEQLASVSAMVSSGGRLFYIVDEGLTGDIRMPSHWQLVARDAFNGIVLWKKPIGDWTDHLHGFRTGPADLPFRMAAVGQHVYVTLGSNAPITALDAATGRSVVTYSGTERTRQVVCTGALVLALGGDHVAVDRKGAGPRPQANRFIQAANAQSGERLWRKDISSSTFLPMVVTDDAVLFQTRAELVCLDLQTGMQRWIAKHPIAVPETGKIGGTGHWATPTLTAQEGIVYVADFRELHAFSLDDGRQLWQSTSAAGFQSPPDIFVIDDVLWHGQQRQRGSADFRDGLDAASGKTVRTIDTARAWQFATLAHHRCYRPKATVKYILSSRSGVEFIDVTTGNIWPNHWVRGTCQYGVLPCNGLLYAPPHSCACNIKTMLKGLHALAPDRLTGARPENNPVCERGPAFGRVSVQSSATEPADDWPTYRHDGQRRGTSAHDPPSKLATSWTTSLDGRLSSPVMSAGKVFVAAVDAHTVYAMDAEDGHVTWSYTAGSRVDSPPTIYRGMALFGAHDGWVYALRANDGKLVWRFRAAPEERQIVVRNQLESAWPVPGSVLIDKDRLLCAAGRSSYLDGGIAVYQLDPHSGNVLEHTTIYSPDRKTGQQPPGGVDLRGVLNDILAADGERIYMRHLQLGFRTGDDLSTGPPHMFAPLGFLDDTWWHRSYWLYASDEVAMPPRNESGWSIWPRMGNMVPSGRILVLDDRLVYGFGRDRYPGGGAGQVRGGEHYQLFAAEKTAPEPLPVNRKDQHLRSARSGTQLGLKVTERNKRYGEPMIHRYAWTQQIPIYVKGMALAGTTLCVAGPPEPSAARSSDLRPANLDQIEAALRGRHGAKLLLVDAKDGKPSASYALSSPPVFDGLLAAGGKIVAALTDGTVICFAADKP